MRKEHSEEIKSSLKSLFDNFNEEDREVRERQIRVWRKLKLYWSGLRVWYSTTARDYRIYDDTETDDNDLYDKPVNIFRAYLETIIAALSINIPAVSASPDDADNPLDIDTARSAEKISKQVYKHNDAILLWLHALYIICTEGMVAAYNYSKEDEKFGTYEDKEYEQEEQDILFCPTCKINRVINKDTSEFQPGEENQVCPTCGSGLEPKTIVIDKLVGITNKPKSRQMIEVHGGLYVKVPSYAMDQSGCPYLIYEFETHYSNALAQYPHLRDTILNSNNNLSSIISGYATDERWARTSTQYLGDVPTDVVTMRYAWFRPSSYYVLDEESSKELEKKFPIGVKAVFCNDVFCDAYNESLDDHWTITKNPLSDYVHYDPLGQFLTSIQDITNDLISLTLQTIEHGIPETHVDPALVDMEAYRNSEKIVGGLYPTKPVAGNKNISEGFFTLKTATLSQEVLPFFQLNQDMGQLSVGALPSLFGGAAEAGSKTASEYSMSRAQALQRLQTPWRMLVVWWKEIFGKVIPQYMKDMVDDERFTEKINGKWENVIIRKAETQGKLGDIELESSDSLPVTRQQVVDKIIQLMELNNPQIMEGLLDPKNIPLIRELIGLSEFHIPGEDDRNKQLEEIQALVVSSPIPSMGQDGMSIELPSVEIDPILDNHAIEAEVCKTWLKSDVGRQAKIDNPPGYMNVLLHMKAHIDILTQIQMQDEEAAIRTEAENKPNGKVKEKKPNLDNPQEVVV